MKLMCFFGIGVFKGLLQELHSVTFSDLKQFLMV